MKREEVTELVSEFLTNITHAEGSNLIRAEYSVAGSVVSVYFFEYSDNDLQIDLVQYQDEFISSDYYNHPGYLQWNYYLIFIRNDESVNKKLKAQIEKDDEYTRKFVFTQEEVKAYFTYKSSKQIIETDVVSKWKEKLRAVDLDEVYADTKYSEAVPRFLNDNVEKENIADQNIATPIQHSELRVDRVSSILLHDSYRTHPRPNRSFDFKTVNLICGANGSGKTSLLTSIELVIAGKSISDPSLHEPTNCISATYNEDMDLTDEYTPNDNLKYRHRDANWYSSSYQTGNELYRTFNRYNYFDSDAAYKLAFDEDKRHISKYLSAIALGPEFGRIQNRMRGFENRLAGELRTREKAIDAQNKRIEDARKVERAVVEVSDPQSLFMLFRSTAIDVGWKSAIPSALTDEPHEFEKEIQEVRVILGALEKLLQTARVHSLAAATKILRQNESNLQKLNESVRSHREAKKRSVDSKNLISQIKTELNILNRAKLYFDNPESFELFSLEDEISDLNQRIARNQEVANAFHLVEEKQLFQSTQRLSASKERVNTEISKALKDKFTANEQKESLMETLDQLKNVISEIKALGLKYLILEKDAKACPLCDTSYPPNQLTERIKKIDLETSENATVKILNDQILSLEQTIENHNAELADINEIEQIIALLHPADIYKNYTFVQIFEALQKTKSDLLADLKTKEILLSKKHTLGQKGITKEETVYSVERVPVIRSKGGHSG